MQMSFKGKSFNIYKLTNDKLIKKASHQSELWKKDFYMKKRF